MTTIDVMHTCLLGVVRDYCVTYLGIALAGKILDDQNKRLGVIPQVDLQTTNICSSELWKRKEVADPDVTPPASQNKRARTGEEDSRRQQVGQQSSPEDAIGKVKGWMALQAAPLHSSRSNQSQRSNISVIIPEIPGLNPPRPAPRTSAEHIRENSASPLRRSPRLHSQTPTSSMREMVLRRNLKGKGKATKTESTKSNPSDLNKAGPSRTRASSKAGPSERRITGLPSSHLESVVPSLAEDPEDLSEEAQQYHITPAELQLIQIGTNLVVTPSWLTRTPLTVGMPSAGTPKASEWLILITIHFVLVLIPLWVWDEQPSPRNKTLLYTTSRLISIMNMVMSHKLPAGNLLHLEKTLQE